MMRTAIFAVARNATVIAAARPSAARSLSMMAAMRRPAASAPAMASQLQQQQLRFASSGALSKEDISSRILEVLKSFEKVDPAKATAESSFTQDLGLDSLDAVEVVMAIEEEFSIEIPDEDADAITTVGQAIDYISRTPEAH